MHSFIYLTIYFVYFLTLDLMDVSNPFKLNHIKNMLRSDFDTVGPCVVMAAPGFMQVHTLMIGYLYTTSILSLLHPTAFSHVLFFTVSHYLSFPCLYCTAFSLPFISFTTFPFMRYLLLITLRQHYSAS